MWAAQKVGALSVNQIEFLLIILIEDPIIKCHENLYRLTDSGNKAASLISKFSSKHNKKDIGTQSTNAHKCIKICYIINNLFLLHVLANLVVISGRCVTID
jgi:hypothetical protein